uniref:Uncharacterized protein n=1 Tax=Glossina austeni TaxID=7395 RepID=A0A1A9VUQ1_GLOAU
MPGIVFALISQSLNLFVILFFSCFEINRRQPKPNSLDSKTRQLKKKTPALLRPSLLSSLARCFVDPVVSAGPSIKTCDFMPSAPAQLLHALFYRNVYLLTCSSVCLIVSVDLGTKSYDESVVREQNACLHPLLTSEESDDAISKLCWYQAVRLTFIHFSSGMSIYYYLSAVAMTLLLQPLGFYLGGDVVAISADGDVMMIYLLLVM